MIRNPQPYLIDPPAMFGARRISRLKIQESQVTPVLINDAIVAHKAAADPHGQYTANDPALRS